MRMSSKQKIPRTFAPDFKMDNGGGVLGKAGKGEKMRDGLVDCDKRGGNFDL